MDTPRSRDALTIERHGDVTLIAATRALENLEFGLEEQVAYTRALDEAGIPYFVGEFEESMTSFDSMEIQLETFVENILFS